MKKLAIVAATLALVIGSAAAYRYETGECPCAALARCLHGDRAKADLAQGKGGARVAAAPAPAP